MQIMSIEIGNDVAREIVVEGNVWIGTDVCTCKGETIGGDSFEMAVARSTPPNCVVAGIPARVVKAT